MHQEYKADETASIPTTNAEHFPSDDTNEAEDEIGNLVSLKLKKPKHWNWELSTSRSCAKISLPRILLFDNKGNLLIDVNSQEDQVFREPIKVPERKSAKRSRKHSSRSLTENLSHSIRQQLNQEFNGLQIQEATPSQLSPNNSTLNTRKSSLEDTSSSCIDFFTNDLPDYKIDRRSSSLRSVRFKDDLSKSSTISLPLNDLATPPPSSATTPTTSSSGPREKRRYRRSRSSGRSSIDSPSILERFSFNKGRFSSPEYPEEHEVHKPPRYFLRASKAGTLLLQEESFSRCRRRRLRPKHSSSENLHKELQKRSRSSSFLQIPENAPAEQSQLENDSSIATSLENVSGKQNKRKAHTRRRRSDTGLCTFSSSEEEFEYPGRRGSRLHLLDGLGGAPQNYGILKKRLKGVPLHPENDVCMHPYGSPTDR